MLLLNWGDWVREIIVGKNDAGQRLDRFLRKSFPSMPPALIQKFIRTKRIKLNSGRAAIDVRLVVGDLVTLYINDDILGDTRADDKARAQTQAHIDKAAAELNIVYEDDNILLVNKPAGMLCHSDDKKSSNTLIGHILTYLIAKGDYNPTSEISFVPALCNRLDRNTGGIVIAAKNSSSLRIMNEKIAKREVEKYYLCLVHGVPSPPSGELENYILRDRVNKLVSVHNEGIAGSKSSKTVYRTLKSQDGISLLECQLITGRTHQIRAQLANAGHPLVGDRKYGKDKDSKTAAHQALYSYKLVFAFTTDAGLLNYLKGQTFEVNVEDLHYFK